MQFDPKTATPSDYAYFYRRIGWQILPASMPGEISVWKRPLLTGWKIYQHKLVSDETFASWYGPDGIYRDRPNMGVVTGKVSGNLFVVDLDIHKHPQAGLWWEGLLAAHNVGLPLQAPTQRTGGGGLQIFIRWPEGRRAPQGATPIGVDIRGEGGFAMLPPSLHESGRNYVWLS